MMLYLSPHRMDDWRWYDRPAPPGSWFGILTDPGEVQTLLELRPYLRGRLPAVSDWATQLLVVAALGQAPTGGYGVQIHRILLRNSIWRVSLYLRNPAPTDSVAQMLTHPVDSVCVSHAIPQARLSELIQLPWLFVDQTGREWATDPA